MDWLAIAVTCGLPSAITGLGFWLVKRQITRQSAQREKLEAEREQKVLEREKHREELILMLLKSTRASTMLSEATARAVQRIPDAKCNGDMSRALEYATKVQNDQKDFLMKLGVHSIYDYYE